MALLWWSIGLFAAFALMGVLIAVNPGSPFTQPLDDWWRGVIGASPDSGLYRTALPMLFQELGQIGGAILTMIVIPAALAIMGRWRSMLFFLSTSLVGALLFAQTMKNLVDRPRPAADAALGLYAPLFQVDHGSFPSGHAVTAGALVFGIAALIPASRHIARRTWWIIGALLMIGMIWQRTLINAHWLSDTVVGLAAGASAALLMWWAFWPLIRSDYGRPVWFLHRSTSTAPATN
ncbi:phosphatase PAP2 family protein [Microbacterium elymi]|uniref:Phosphatase PAP2 family protein n=1 Tax=Microbacterium elymi TaxID=2909587 RepID=A0ABY5NHT7_9MICO|nr:phosphatase PAP2 family protein [Microbacterium elymi]UUT34713.1 phosphatase PAP2 family protein [Microbacterium elymi]